MAPEQPARYCFGRMYLLVYEQHFGQTAMVITIVIKLSA